MILITGVNGQLGHDFQRLFDEIKEEYIATDVNDLDITYIGKVREFIKDKKISLIINCAAYNNVDKAEDEPELCKKLNTDAPRDLAIVANEIGADYITYSTDFVFDGKKKTPYTEEDTPNPLSVYGKTKYEGEKEVFKVKPNSFIVRTSWVFGIANNNFNKQVINWSKTKDELSIVDDQISSPTYSKDLAYYSWELIKTKKYGLYHLSNSGEASKYDQAKYILDKIGWQGKLNKAKTKEFNLKAKRAEYTKLDSSKLEKVIGTKIPSWENGIDNFCGEFGSKKKLVLFFTIKEFTKAHLYKDVGLTPYYLGKEYDLDVDIVYSNKKKQELPNHFRNISLIEISYHRIWRIIGKIDKFKLLENISFYKYLLKNAKKINYLMLFHLGIDKFLLILLYKYLNKSGKIYLKLDMNKNRIIELKNIKGINIKNFFRKKILKKVNLISIEIIDGYDEILQNGLCNQNISSKIAYITAGFDEYYLMKNNVKIKTFEAKENIMITVGRIGTREKNNEMLLETLNNIDLKNWKIYIIGPYTKEFKTKYNKFIKGNQDKKENVILVGNIENKKLLYDYYNRAKVFLLTSRWEGFATVYPEALKFGNYIITTNVGGAQDITDNNKIGTITEIENTYQFSDEMLKVVNNEIDLQEKYKNSIKLSKEKFLWNKIVKDKKFKEFFYEEQ